MCHALGWFLTGVALVLTWVLTAAVVLFGVYAFYRFIDALINDGENDAVVFVERLRRSRGSGWGTFSSIPGCSGEVREPSAWCWREWRCPERVAGVRRGSRWSCPARRGRGRSCSCPCPARQISRRRHRAPNRSASSASIVGTDRLFVRPTPGLSRQTAPETTCLTPIRRVRRGCLGESRVAAWSVPTRS
jgi:hypothetical protein